MKRVGIFGGTFDPVHFGHLNLAISLLEKHSLQEVWWIPAHINPLKSEKPLSAGHRLAMLQLALQDAPFFKILDIELQRSAPSYTIDTIKDLKKRHPDVSFYFLMGEDALYQLKNWKEPEEIVRLAPPLIGSRKAHQFPSSLALSQEMQNVCQLGWTSIPVLEIAATEVRKRLKESKICDHLVPRKVLDYISLNDLY